MPRGPLARLEGQVVLDGLLDRFPGAALAGAPQFEGAPLRRAPSRLPMRLR